MKRIAIATFGAFWATGWLTLSCKVSRSSSLRDVMTYDGDVADHLYWSTDSSEVGAIVCRAKCTKVTPINPKTNWNAELLKTCKDDIQVAQHSEKMPSFLSNSAMSKPDVTGRRKLTDDERKSLDAMFSEFFTGEDGVELSRTFKSQDGTEFSVDQIKNKCREHFPLSNDGVVVTATSSSSTHSGAGHVLTPLVQVAERPLQLGICPRDNKLPANFCPIPTGSFEMGTNDPKAWSIPNSFPRPTHKVTFNNWRCDFSSKRRCRNLEMMDDEATENLYNFVMQNRNGANKPKHSVSWTFLNQTFLPKLNDLLKDEGFYYRLPTEAEWEYAARFGTTLVGVPEQECKRYLKNDWGLSKMLGSLQEWVQDEFLISYPEGDVTDPLIVGVEPRFLQENYTARGGIICETTARFNVPDSGDKNIGFRLVRTSGVIEGAETPPDPNWPRPKPKPQEKSQQTSSSPAQTVEVPWYRRWICVSSFWSANWRQGELQHGSGGCDGVVNSSDDLPWCTGGKANQVWCTPDRGY